MTAMKLNRKNFGKKSRFKSVLIISTVASFLLYFYSKFNIDFMMSTMKKNVPSPLEDADTTKDSLYVINTVACKIPNFDLSPSLNIRLPYKIPLKNCLKPLMSTNSSGIFVKMNEIEEIQNYFQVKDLQNVTCVYYHKTFPDQIRDVRKTEFSLLNFHYNIFEYDNQELRNNFFPIQIECHLIENETLIYQDYFFPNPTKLDEIEKESVNDGRSGKNEFEENPDETRKSPNNLSVLFFGISGVSRLQFLREMKMTLDYLKSNTRMINLNGFQLTENSTTLNLISILTGLSPSELNSTCFNRRHNNSCHFIWDKYKLKNFETIYAAPKTFTTNLKQYFYNDNFPNFDYSVLPLLPSKKDERFLPIKVRSGYRYESCSGRRDETDVIFEFVNNYFFKLFHENDKVRKLFGFLWFTPSSQITYDHLDKQFYQLFKNFQNIMDNTVIFILSDDNGQFQNSYQGRMENRHPFLFVITPKWLSSNFIPNSNNIIITNDDAELYKNAFNNLKYNAQKFTSNFDIYTTLLDLIDYTKTISNSAIELKSNELLEMEQLPRGISLFLPIPPERTCESIGITPILCTCYRKLQTATSDFRAQKAARFIVRHINEKIYPFPQCRTLYLNSIMKVNFYSPAKKSVITEFNMITDINLRIQVKPGMGEFETTIRIMDENLLFADNLIRTDFNKRQNYCVDEDSVKIFCYCDR